LDLSRVKRMLSVNWVSRLTKWREALAKGMTKAKLAPMMTSCA
jgi:hypothetical protein